MFGFLVFWRNMLRIIGILLVGIVSFSASMIALAKLKNMPSEASVVSTPSPSPSPMSSISPELPEPSTGDVVVTSMPSLIPSPVVSPSPTTSPEPTVWVRSRHARDEDDDDD